MRGAVSGPAGGWILRVGLLLLAKWSGQLPGVVSQYCTGVLVEFESDRNKNAGRGIESVMYWSGGVMRNVVAG
jgi:hypothetical protein